MIEVYLGQLAQVLGWLSELFYDWSEDVADVWLIGEYMSDRLALAGGRFSDASTAVDEFKSEWRYIWPGLSSMLAYAFRLSDLGRWYYDILDIVQHPGRIIQVYLPELYPFLAQIASDPKSALRDTVRALIAEVAGDLSDLRKRIDDYLGELIPQFAELKASAAAWVATRLIEYSPDVARFLSDPEGWFLDRLRAVNPDVVSLLEDPLAWVFGKLDEQADRLAERFGDALARLAGAVLDKVL